MILDKTAYARANEISIDPCPRISNLMNDVHIHISSFYNLFSKLLHLSDGRHVMHEMTEEQKHEDQQFDWLH